jgi:hypothetical protein
MLINGAKAWIKELQVLIEALTYFHLNASDYRKRDIVERAIDSYFPILDGGWFRIKHPIVAWTVAEPQPGVAPFFNYPKFIFYLIEGSENNLYTETQLQAEVERFIAERKLYFQRLFTAILELREFMEALADAPIKDVSRWEEKALPQRTYADMQGEIANELVHLPRYTARVKLSDGSGNTVEHTIQTIAPTRGLYGTALQERVETIHQQNIRDKYIRPLNEVEAEITERQTRCSQQVLSSPQPPPPSATRKAAPPCPSCGFSNPQGSRFCNQCGAQL